MASFLNVEPSTMVVRGSQSLVVPADISELVFESLVVVAGASLAIILPMQQTDLKIRCCRFFSIAEGSTLEISSPSGARGSDGQYKLFDRILFAEAEGHLASHPSPPWVARDQKKHDLYLQNINGPFRQGPIPRSRVEFRTQATGGGNGSNAPHLQVFSSRILLDSASIQVRGGDGGKGGTGPQGWKGKNGGGRWSGGGTDGKKGEPGAPGGNGGDGGQVSLWAASISIGASPLAVDAIGGEPGGGGDGGKGGDPGDKRPGRSQKNVRGDMGSTGRAGNHGEPGKASAVFRTLTDIDPAALADDILLALTATLTSELPPYSSFNITSENAVEVLRRLKSDDIYYQGLENHDKIAEDSSE